MHDLKFLTLFRTLKAEEATDFRKYLKRTRGNGLVALEVFDFIRKQDMEQLQLKDVCRKLYKSDTSQVQKNLLNTLSDLHLWLKEFLLFTKATNTSFEGRILWLSILKERSLEPEFSKQVDLLLHEVEAAAKTEDLDYLKSLTVHHFAYFGQTSVSASQANSLLDGYLNDLITIIPQESKAACEMLNLRNIRPSRFKSETWLENLKHATPAAADHDLLSVLYQKIRELLETQQVSLFTGIESILSEKAGSIHPKELNGIISYLHNFAALQIRKGKEELWQRAHYLNRLSLEHQVLEKNGEMSVAQFQNIINAACKVQDFHWANLFIATQINLLPPDVRSEAELMAHMMIAFEKKEYRQVVDAFEKALLKDLHVQIRMKTLALISYYELETEIDLLNYCINFELFLKRHQKLLAGAVQGILNFLQAVKMLIRKRGAQEEILDFINESEMLTFRTWLKGKAEGYKAVIVGRK